MVQPVHTVLVVEDEKPLSDAITHKLQKNGFEVVTARAVDQALEYMQNVPSIDAVWLDHYLLGNGSGIDFVKALKGNNAWENIPVFVVSNTASPDKIETYKKLGISKYFLKAEHRLDDIIREIRQIIGQPEAV